MLFRYAVLVLDLEGEINTATRVEKKRVNIFCSARRIYKHIYILSNLTDLYISVRVVIKIVQIHILHLQISLLTHSFLHEKKNTSHVGIVNEYNSW